MRAKNDVRNRVHVKPHLSLPWFSLGVWCLLAGLFGLFSPGLARAANVALGAGTLSFDPGETRGWFFPLSLFEQYAVLWWGMLLAGSSMLGTYGFGYAVRSRGQ